MTGFQVLQLTHSMRKAEEAKSDQKSGEGVFLGGRVENDICQGFVTKRRERNIEFGICKNRSDLCQAFLECFM